MEAQLSVSPTSDRVSVLLAVGMQHADDRLIIDQQPSVAETEVKDQDQEPAALFGLSS